MLHLPPPHEKLWDPPPPPCEKFWGRPLPWSLLFEQDWEGKATGGVGEPWRDSKNISSIYVWDKRSLEVGDGFVIWIVMDKVSKHGLKPQGTNGFYPCP